MFSPLLYSNDNIPLLVLGIFAFFSILVPIMMKYGLLSNVSELIPSKQRQLANANKQPVKVGDKATLKFEKGFVGLYGINNNLGKIGKYRTEINDLQSGLHNSLLPNKSGIEIFQKQYDKDDSELVLSMEVEVKEVVHALVWVNELKQICCDNGILLVIQRHT
jgi:hypothetical protein